MDFTEITNRFSAVNDVGLASRMKIIFTGLRVIGHLLFHTDAVQVFLNHALHSEEVTGAVHSQCKLHPFVRIIGQRQFLRQINDSQFVKLRFFVPVAIIESQGGQHTV